MIRFEDSCGDWYEYKDSSDGVDVTITYRSSMNPTWSTVQYFSSLEQVREYWKGMVPGFKEVTTLVLGTEFLHSPVTTTPSPLHKCYCNWDKVYREGCSCGGL